MTKKRNFIVSGDSVGWNLPRNSVKKKLAQMEEEFAYWTCENIEKNNNEIAAIDLKNEKLVFTLGYPKADDTERRLVFKNPKIRIGTGRPEWGAEPGKLYFVISWDKE